MITVTQTIFEISSRPRSTLIATVHVVLAVFFCKGSSNSTTSSSSSSSTAVVVIAVVIMAAIKFYLFIY